MMPPEASRLPARDCAVLRRLVWPGDFDAFGISTVCQRPASPPSLALYAIVLGALMHRDFSTLSLRASFLGRRARLHVIPVAMLFDSDVGREDVADILRSGRPIGRFDHRGALPRVSPSRRSAWALPTSALAHYDSKVVTSR